MDNKIKEAFDDVKRDIKTIQAYCLGICIIGAVSALVALTIMWNG